jgi:hypothetical protein
MSFDENGDPVEATETVYLAKGGEWTFFATKALK